METDDQRKQEKNAPFFRQLSQLAVTDAARKQQKNIEKEREELYVRHRTIYEKESEKE